MRRSPRVCLNVRSMVNWVTRSGRERLAIPRTWVIGGHKREPDVVLIFAADDHDDLNKAVAGTVKSLFPLVDEKGKVVFSGASLLYRQDGDTLSGPLAGHEHFGFKDGVSQPGVAGLLPDGTPLTPSQNPLDPGQGKPGQDLLWPGEFVFGYPGQDPKKEIDQPGKDPLKSKDRKAPEFARNGSFLVFRRLRQDVGAFHRFLGQLSSQFGVAPAFVGARMVGLAERSSGGRFTDRRRPGAGRVTIAKTTTSNSPRKTTAANLASPSPSLAKCARTSRPPPTILTVKNSPSQGISAKRIPETTSLPPFRASTRVRPRLIAFFAGAFPTACNRLLLCGAGR